jgi:2-(1,2-epoxy-1,2-dihydrophenyl)acetyl-CoA isomerase
VTDQPSVTLSYDEGERVATITLNRPGRRNALDFDSWEQLNDRLAQASASLRCEMIVITGAGGFFCSGGDLQVPPARGSKAFARAARVELAQGVIRRIAHMPQIAIAAVDGGAHGLGWSLALACDLVVADEAATFTAPFCAVGAVADGGLVARLVAVLGRNRAMRVALGLERLTATDAHTLGLVDALAPAGGSSARAADDAQALLKLSSNAVQLTKSLVRAVDRPAVESFLALELGVAALAQHHPDAAEGRAAFLERRPAEWAAYGS